LLGPVVTVPETVELFFFETSELALFLGSHSLDSLYSLADDLPDQRHNGVIVVIAVALGQPFNSHLHHLVLNLLGLFAFQGLVEFLDGLFDNAVEELIGVELFIGVCLGQDTLCSGGQMLLQQHMLVD